MSQIGRKPAVSEPRPLASDIIGLSKSGGVLRGKVVGFSRKILQQAISCSSDGVPEGFEHATGFDALP